MSCRRDGSSVTGSVDSLGGPSAQGLFPLQDRLPCAPGDRALLSLLIILIVAVPTVFVRTTFTTFDAPQLTLLWVLAVAIALIGVYRVLVSGVVERGPQMLTLASVAFLSALVITSVLSDQPWVAFTGLTVRGAGAVTYGLCLILMHAVYRLGRRRSLESLLLAFVGAHGLVVLYALMQAYGLDPFTWGAGILYVGPVFSTLGNPNFSAGYVGLTLPLVVWVAFGSRFPVVLRVIGGAGVGASSVALAYLNSFQGDVAALAAIAVLGQWVWQRGRRDRLVAVAIVLPVAAVITGVPLMLDTPAKGTLLSLAVVSGACAGLGTWWDRHSSVEAEAVDEDAIVEPETVTLFGGPLWHRSILVLAVMAAGVVLFGSRVLDQLGSGLEQRFAFWRTSLSIFASSPIVGTGLETYPAQFTAHRPLSHAMEYEFVLSDSPHSVPLGLLSGGGLLLALTYLATMTVIFWAGLRAVRYADGSERSLYVAVLAAWVAYQVQSSVSIDMPGLIYTQWVLGGILLAGGMAGGRLRPVLPWVSGKVRLPSVQRDHRWRTVGLALPVVGVLVLLLGPLTAPLRADLAAYRAQKALDRTDFQTAGDELLRAIDLQPRNGLYAEGMALVYAESGLLDLAYEERVRSARLRPGNPYSALVAARAAIGMGHLEVAEYWLERAVSVEPNGAEILTDVALVLADIGRQDKALQLIDSFELLRSPNTSAWRTVMEVHLAVGNEIAAERDRLCSTGGQEGCWEEG